MEDSLDLQTSYRTILDAARRGNFISYGELAKANGADWSKVRFKLNGHLGELVKLAAERNWPIPCAIVVNQGDLRTGKLEGSARQGLINAAKESGFDVQDPEAFVEKQQEAMFEWALEAPDDLGLPICQATSTTPISGPKFVQFFGPVLDTLRALGGAAEPKDVTEKVKELADVTTQELQETIKNGHSKYENQVAWARFYLSKAGFIDSKQRGRWVLTAEGRETYLDHESAVALFRDVHSRYRDTAGDEGDPAPPPSEDSAGDLFEDPKRSFWFVGALWGEDDQTEHFLSHGIWKNGHDKKFAEHVQHMKPGDRIAIKASFTKKYGLPFENQDKSVSCMRIKAIGTVIEGTKDGQTIKVEWTRLDKPKDWYFYTYRVTIVEADVSDELARQLIQFTFGDHKQDYDFWLRQPYWAKKYLSSPGTVADAQSHVEEAETDVEEPYDIADIIADGCFLPEDELSAALARLSAKKKPDPSGAAGNGKDVACEASGLCTDRYAE